MTTTSTERTKLEILTELAKLSPFELSAVMAKVEREKANQLAKSAKKPGRRSFANWGTPLNPR
ncbi:hypothetical protein [Rhodanobacter sp. DHB23]|uniref:hypothetical protein n=1 Tax=Rhodanobacter sp. DHB23 TaxID=2775923 RepID=UPI0017833F1D|nr:hypothetical protein [Rhodanobacter sp. DHB23]MBD8873867.1 hypothetical protein [Rhodanobacter sp. DHB23]